MNSMTIWLTGLSGSGKTTLATMLTETSKVPFVMLDGDLFRKTVSSDLGFSEADRIENNRRLIEVCKLLNTLGHNVVTAFISPIESVRQLAKKRIDNCHIVYVYAPLEVCEERDPKGLYKKVRAGEIEKFTGISSPYEYPVNPDLELHTEIESEVQCLEKLSDYIGKVRE